ncbi:MAG TPA: hypothetical protein DIT35_02525, partial [Rhodospirillaceae bacterium]|nr:hypothetical protein [Rhodospirillaceae bacterium]
IPFKSTGILFFLLSYFEKYKYCEDGYYGNMIHWFEPNVISKPNYTTANNVKNPVVKNDAEGRHRLE